MLLKRLELQGFKSFADKTVLDFRDGTTAVVGPNGSGKSNISDAIRWVIGETSAKSLRGSNMQDVIFAGTETRKALNYAEVSLILDNSAHDFNVDFNEVKVTRRLFRSGESVYRINDANCRLKDVHELFMDTGLGRDGYSMIGQGNVSQILSTKAEDRRSLFEEAAGVSKYRYKKEEAVRKLAKVDENLVRISDISTELEGQLAPLLRQSEKARKYLEIYGDMKQLDINLSIISIDKNTADTEAANAQYKSVEDELSDVKSRETENERRMELLYEENKRSDEEKTAANASLMENESRISSANNDINIYENNIKNNTQNINRLEAEIVDINSKNEERTKLIRDTETEIKTTSEEIDNVTSKLSGAKSAAAEYESNLNGIDEHIQKLRDEFFNRKNEIAQEQERANGIEALRSSYIERREAVYTEISSFKEGIENTKKQIAEADANIAKRKSSLEELSGTVNELSSSKEKAETGLREVNSKLAAMQVEYNTKSSKKRMLEGLENDYAGYAGSVKAVLTAQELKRLAIYGTISGLVDVDKEYVTAIETALGGALQNIIVESENDAKQAIAYLRRTGGGRATFLPVTSVKGRMLDNVRQIAKSAGFIGIASELIKYERKYDGIFTLLLGRVVVVDNIDNAIAMSRAYGYKFKVVTLAGDVLNAGGSMSGGSVNKRTGFLSRAAEIKTLTSEIAALMRDIKKNEEEKISINSDISLINSQLDSFMPLVREYEDEIIRLENTKKMLITSLEGSDSEGMYRELEQLEAQLAQTADDVAKLIAHVSSMNTKNAALEEKIAGLIDNRNEILQKRNDANSDSDEISERLAELNKNIAVARQTITAAYGEINRSKDELSARRERIDEYKRSSSDYALRIDEKKALVSDAESLSEEIREKLRVIDERKADISDKIKRSSGDSKDIMNRIVELEKELSRVENKRIRLETEYDSIINRLWDDYGLGYSDAAELKTDVEDVKAAAEELAELKKKIKALGSVNMDSIEEYKAVKERYEFMTTQKADLEKSKANLNKIIDSMEELMKSHFGGQFCEINKAFSDVFRELFGGGRGRLYLSNPDDVLSSGIEIEVQLPGKGMQNLNLYSGGEKSFIAIALLFAILRVKPTPFCILDEIDAALDDV
ncbi:MAG: chromosome segregation protein SMC, partial [Oscillospiraceae bacterium]|nr:chromosome segregation protein SMC [Oscillospiraceae bacterium]